MEQLLPYAEGALDLLRGACREFLVRTKGSADASLPYGGTAPPELLLRRRGRRPAACAIARIDGNGDAARRAGGVATIPRGSVLTPLPGPDPDPDPAAAAGCRTAYDVTLAPVRLSRASFYAAPPPDAPRLPPGASAAISLVIESCEEAPPLDRLALPALRVYLDGEPGFCAALRDALFAHTVCAYVEVAGSGHWSLLDRTPLSPVGCAAADAPPPAAPGRLLEQYLCFPETFNFVDIDVAALVHYLPRGGRSLALHLALARVPPDSDMARRLARLSSENLLPACTPLLDPPGSAGVFRLHCSTRQGAPAFADLLSLYDPAQPALHQCVIAAIAGLVHRPAQAWLRGRSGATLVRGVAVRMALDERAFAGHGLHAFAQAMAAFLAGHVDPAGFVELLLVSGRDGAELLRCPPRHGDPNLVRANAGRLD